MRVQYQAILDDFETEISALSELADATQIGSTLSPGARISLGNSLTLVLASVFEEYVRQLVRAAWAERLIATQDPRKFPSKLRSKLWRSALERTARFPFAEIESQSRTTRDKIHNVLKFCLDGDFNVPIEHEISHNDNNMRPDQINLLFSQIGISNVLQNGCDFQDIMNFFACQNAGQAAQHLRNEIDGFFVRRNTVAHAIAFGSSGGANAIHRDIEVFRLASRALANGVDLFIEP